MHFHIFQNVVAYLLRRVYIHESLTRWDWRYQSSNQNRKSKKDRQHNEQKKKNKRTNNDLHTTYT